MGNDGMRVPDPDSPARQEQDPVVTESQDTVDDRGTPLMKDGQRLSGYDHNDEPVYGDRSIEVGDAGFGNESQGG